MRKTMLALALAVATLSAAAVPVSALGSSTGGEPPLADAGLDQRVTVGTTVSLDATGSRDPDGRIVSYRWRVETPDGGTTVPTPPNRGRTSLTVTEPGRYEVTVTVTDDDGNTASDTLYVVVDGTPTATPRPSTPEPPTPRTTSTPPTTSTPAPPDTTVSSTTRPTAPTGPTAPPSAAPPSPEPPEPPGPECTDSFGPDCITPPDCTDIQRLESDCIRFLRVEGPDTLAEGETGTYTAVTEGFDGEVSFRWQAGEVSRSVDRTFSPGEHTVVVTATDGERTFIAEKTVYVDRNAPPKVGIEAPGALEPGESIVLSLSELRDPDGTVTSVSWSGGSRVREVRSMETVRSVTVPDGNGSKRVEVTAVDDDGESATDSVIIRSSQTTYLRSEEQPTKRIADCTFYDYGSGVTDQPIRCWNKATGEVIYDRDPNEGPEDFVGPHSHPNWVVNWHQVARPDDDTIQPGTAMAKAVPAPNNQTQKSNSQRANTTESQNETIAQIVNSSESESGYDSFTKNGQSVSNDLTGDGRVDLQDWQERYGDPSPPSPESDFEKIESMRSDSSSENPPVESETTPGDDAGVSETVQDTFEGISDTVQSLTGQSESNEQTSSQDSEGSISDTVSDTVDSITESFANLTGGGENSDRNAESSGSSGSDEQGSDSTESSGDSCSETTLGFSICF